MNYKGMRKKNKRKELKKLLIVRRRKEERRAVIKSITSITCVWQCVLWPGTPHIALFFQFYERKKFLLLILAGFCE